MRGLLLVMSFLYTVTSISKNQRPNILWIVCEDISPTLSVYGDTTAKTPCLEAFAKDAIVFDNAFATVGVCAPSRSSIITGMHATSIGTMHMRTAKDVFSWGRRTYKENKNTYDLKLNSIAEYSAVVPEEIKCFSEYLRAAGYFCTNNQKTDYQFAAPITAWDENNLKAHWRNRPLNTPFFSVFNLNTTHESKLWKHEKLPLTVDVNKVKIPPYLQDTKISRKTIARNYSNIELMDKEFGVLIDQLKSDGLYQNTIIFFYSDHGGPLPRQKREILDSGLKVPLLIKELNSKKNTRTDRLVSFTDLAPTVLSLANIKPPSYMDGKAFLGLYTSKPRSYVYGSSDRFDAHTDRIRSVRNKQYLYLKNYHSALSKYKDLDYRKQLPLMQEMLELQNNNRLNHIQGIWFESKTNEELYDCVSDPFNLNNVAGNPKYAEILEELRSKLVLKSKKQKDFAEIPESEMILSMWPNNVQPVTQNVVFKQKTKGLCLSSVTKGASIAYCVSEENNLKLNYNSRWKLYSNPLTLKKGMYLYTIAERIGFKPSEIRKIRIE